MEYKRNQNSYEELQTIVETQQKEIETLLTKLCRIRVLVLDEEIFNEAMKDASEGGEIKTEFKLDRNEIYSLYGTTEEQREKLYSWLLENDSDWDMYNLAAFGKLMWSNTGNQWIRTAGKPTKYIKDLM